MSTTATPHAESIAIRSRIESLVQALRDKDVDTLMTHYAPQNITFDLQPPLQVNGADAYRKNFERWFAIIEGPIGYDVRDLRITASDDTAFCHSVCQVTSTRTNGEKADYWVRVTSGLRKINDQWMITHEHVSMPIYMQTMQAAPGSDL
jgi:ketosteroid isomerase-like protein